MPNSSDANIATADVLTLLLHNQHALAAAIEELSLWAKSSGASETLERTAAALTTLDENATTISAGIFKLRQ